MKKTQELKDTRGLSQTAIYDKIKEEKKRLANLIQDKTLGKLKNLHEITTVRKNIARLSTVVYEKVYAEVSKEESK